MAANLLLVTLGFAVSFVVSTIIIYLVTKFFGEKEGIWHAALAAIIGSVIYAIAHALLGGLLGAVAGGIVWLLALRGLYEIGWARAFVIAFAIWLLASAVSLVLPTLGGPL
ncbi:MAG: hypothetical protein QXF55_02825 [Candidatus Aenigmatarchaeota archaeon]